jgi:ABC-type uncharacterized transport system permease subunit
VHLILAGLILGIAAVWGVPLISSVLKSVLPAQAQAYLPPTAAPGFSIQALIASLIYGLIVFAVLLALEGLGKAVTHKKLRVGA